MENTDPSHNTQGRNNIRPLLIIAAIGLMVTSFASYISGFQWQGITFNLTEWVTALALAIFISKICSLLSLFSKRKILLYLPYLIFIPSLFNSFNLVAFEFFAGSYWNSVWGPNTISSLIYVTTYMFLVITLIKELNYVKSHFIKLRNSVTEEVLNFGNGQQSSTNEAIQSFQAELGSGKSLLDKVISSILSRASGANKTVTFTLITMLVIVVIGGGASFGTVALSEARKVRELEMERLKLLELVNKIPSYDSTQLSMRNKEIKDMIFSYYGNETSYKNILENIEKQSYVSWPDIAMRITIAALTLFLVQIFFHIYKYNQQQASSLYTRAEILELYKDPDANQNELRAGLLAKIDSNPKFEKTPPTPTDHLINVINNSKDVK